MIMPMCVLNYRIKKTALLKSFNSTDYSSETRESVRDVIIFDSNGRLPT